MANQQVALVTGVSSGIGEATARALAAEGFRVFGTVRSADGIVPDGVEHVAMDVRDEASVAAAVTFILSRAGRIDALVNNAGATILGAIEETDTAQAQALFDVNFFGAARVTRAVLPAMRARRGGAVVTIGSVSGRVALPMVGPYHASKWALEGMIEALRYELIPFGIRVALVEPGAYRTELHVNEIRARAAGRGDSPYAALLETYQRQSAALRRDGVDALVDVIYRAATSPHPRLRWFVGPTSFTGGRMRAFCPDWLYEWLMRIAFRIRAPRL